MVQKMFVVACFLVCSLGTICFCMDSQPSVISGTKEHALYLWLYVNPDENATKIANVAANLQKHVDFVSPVEEAEPETEVIAGVGFGEAFYAKISKQPKNFSYVTRKGAHGTMPATGGDIFVHAKSDSISKLFELTQEILRQMPADSVSFEDVYGWVYKNGRDLSGFIDGTENPADPDHRRRVAVDETTGGSFVLTQRWVHNFTFIDMSSVVTLENIIGRTLNDSSELRNKPASSHVARMVGSTDYNAPARFEVVRQSQPYGTLSRKAGLFFIAYSNRTANLNFMLDNMVGAGREAHNDDVMLLSNAVSGNYWYFPGALELQEFE